MIDADVIEKDKLIDAIYAINNLDEYSVWRVVSVIESLPNWKCSKKLDVTKVYYIDVRMNVFENIFEVYGESFGKKCCLYVGFDINKDFLFNDFIHSTEKVLRIYSKPEGSFKKEIEMCEFFCLNNHLENQKVREKIMEIIANYRGGAENAI